MIHTLSLKRVYRVKLRRVMLTMAIKIKHNKENQREIREIKFSFRGRSNFGVVHRVVNRVVRCGEVNISNHDRETK